MEIAVTAPGGGAASPAGGCAPVNGAGPHRGSASFWALTLGSLGVVYGDIGTSPLYAFRESILAAVGANGVPSEPAVFGILSLIIWVLIVVVTLKYVLILLSADNNGEGGTLALMALANRALGGRSGLVILLGIASGVYCGPVLRHPAELIQAANFTAALAF